MCYPPQAGAGRPDHQRAGGLRPRGAHGRLHLPQTGHRRPHTLITNLQLADLSVKSIASKRAEELLPKTYDEYLGPVLAPVEEGAIRVARPDARLPVGMPARARRGLTAPPSRKGALRLAFAERHAP